LALTSSNTGALVALATAAPCAKTLNAKLNSANPKALRIEKIKRVNIANSKHQITESLCGKRMRHQYISD
jgi:hypothetical protein